MVMFNHKVALLRPSKITDVWKGRKKKKRSMLNLLWLVLVLMFPNLAKIAWKPPIHNSISFSQRRSIETGNEIQSDKRFPQTASSFHVLCLFTVTHNLIIPFAFCSWNFSCLLKPFNNTSFFPPLWAWKKSAKEFTHFIFTHTKLCKKMPQWY